MKVLALIPFPIPYSRGSPIKALETSELIEKSKEVEKFRQIALKSPDKHNLKNLTTPPLIITEMGFSFKKLLSYFMLFFLAIREVNKNEYDIIHAHDIEAGFFAVLLKKFYKIPVVTDLHQDFEVKLDATNSIFIKTLKPFLMMIERYVLRNSDKVIAMSQVWKKDLEKRGYKNIEVLYSSSDIYKPRNTEKIKNKLGLKNEKVVLYSGNFEPYQGVDLLVDAAELVVKKYKNVKFVLVGNAENSEYPGLIKRKNLENHFIFTGFINKKETPDYYDLANILIIPRRKIRFNDMPMPRKITDYMAAGKAIVATDVSDHKILIGNDAGVITKPNKESLSKGILYLLKNSGKTRKMGKTGLKKLKTRYSWNNFQKELIRIYKEVTTKAI